MTNHRNDRSYNFGDTFGEPAECNSLAPHAEEEGSGPWCNQADGILEQDDAIRSQGGLA